VYELFRTNNHPVSRLIEGYCLLKSRHNKVNSIRERDRGWARGDKNLRSTLHFPPERRKIISPGLCGMAPECLSTRTRNPAGTPDLHALYLLCSFSNEHPLQ
jgi:hypothetical protein